MPKTRSLICLMTGHVDHGKSKIIETISNLKILDKEAGHITQTISAVNVDIEKIKKICGGLFDNISLKIKIPGFLLIDSPGHAAFTNLRKRGGSIADIAVLVVDVNEGMLQQTMEALEILKQYKTPFIIALNKIDLITGWNNKDKSLLKNIALQNDYARNTLDTKLYEIVGTLYEKGFNAERFDRVSDYSKQIAIVPLSAKTKEGLAEMLMVLTGLAGKYLETELQIEISGPGRGVLLEVKDQKGVGTCMDVILYDGKIKVNDVIVIGGLNEPIVSKVKCLYHGKISVDKDEAASCLRINAPDTKGVMPGMPLMVCVGNKLEEVKKIIQQEVNEVIIDTDNKGIVVKADSLGSLEALVGLLKQEGIKIKKASVGEINKKDIADAKADDDELCMAVVGFNVKNVKCDVHVITSDIIYDIVDKLNKWKSERQLELESKKLEKVVKPCKFRILPGYVFRQSNPAVVGVEIITGTLKAGIPIMDEDGKNITEVKSIQEDGKNVSSAEEKKQVAISLPGVIVGRQIIDGQTLYSDMPENDFKEFKVLKKLLKNGEIELLKEIAVIKRKNNIVWGV